MTAEDAEQISSRVFQMMEANRVFDFASVSLKTGDLFDFGLNDMNLAQRLPSDGHSWFKGPDDSHECNCKPSNFEAMVRAKTSLIRKRPCVVCVHNILSIPWQRSQLDWSFVLDLLSYEKVVSDSCLWPWRWPHHLVLVFS